MNRFITLLLILTSCGPVLPIENPFDQPAVNQLQEVQEALPLRIFILDVGQGDATLVIGPDGRTLLIDAGPPVTGADAVLSIMADEGIEGVDWILLTHYDTDHIGGIPEILGNLRPRIGLIDRGNNTTEENRAYQGYRVTAEAIRKTAEPGDRVPLGNGASATVVVVNGRYSDGRRIHLNPEEENESSIGLLIRYGNFSYFTAGDLTGGGSPGGYDTKEMESWAAEIIGDIDILHVGHHGSASSTNPHLLEITKPEVAVISVGEDNDYGHPSPIVLDRLHTAGTEVYRTDLSGTVRIVSDGNGYEVSTSLRK